jgi:hypothetical protein
MDSLIRMETSSAAPPLAPLRLRPRPRPRPTKPGAKDEQARTIVFQAPAAAGVVGQIIPPAAQRTTVSVLTVGAMGPTTPTSAAIGTVTMTCSATRMPPTHSADATVIRHRQHRHHRSARSIKAMLLAARLTRRVGCVGRSRTTAPTLATVLLETRQVPSITIHAAIGGFTATLMVPRPMPPLSTSAANMASATHCVMTPAALHGLHAWPLQAVLAFFSARSQATRATASASTPVLLCRHLHLRTALSLSMHPDATPTAKQANSAMPRLWPGTVRLTIKASC